jgi:chromosome segregation ATPase
VAQVEQYQEKIQALLAQCHQEQEAMEQQQEELEGLRAAAAQLQSSSATLEEENKALQATVAQEEARAAAAEHKLDQLTKQYNAAKVQFHKLKKLAEDRKARVTLLEQQLQQQQPPAGAAEEVEQLQASLQQHVADLEAARAEVSDLQQKVRTVPAAA